MPGMNYVDLGLPSGMLWADRDEPGLYSWEEARARFGRSLPSFEQVGELLTHAPVVQKLDEEGRAFFLLTGPNGSSLQFVGSEFDTITANGERFHYRGKANAFFWTRDDFVSMCGRIHGYAGHLKFEEQGAFRDVFMYLKGYRFPVRLVRKVD